MAVTEVDILSPRLTGDHVTPDASCNGQTDHIPQRWAWRGPRRRGCLGRGLGTSTDDQNGGIQSQRAGLGTREWRAMLPHEPAMPTCQLGGRSGSQDVQKRLDL